MVFAKAGLRAVHAGLLACLIAALAACAQGQLREAPPTDALLGTWKVDLRPTPDAEPYFQELVVTSVEGKSFSGTFYNTPVTEARLNSDWGTLRIAFMTEDGSGEYHHSAVLQDGELIGLSNSTGRDFLSYWRAFRE